MVDTLWGPGRLDYSPTDTAQGPERGDSMANTPRGPGRGGDIAAHTYHIP